MIIMNTETSEQVFEDQEIERIGDYETNIINIAKSIFSKDPQSPKTVRLIIDDKQYENDIYMNIAWFGMKYLFDSDTLPENMSEKQFMLLNKYMASMGKIILADITIEDEIKIKIENL